MSQLDVLNENIKVLKTIDLSYEANYLMIFAISFSVVFLFASLWNGSKHEKLNDRLGASVLIAIASILLVCGIEDQYTALELTSAEVVAVERVQASIRYIEQGRHVLKEEDLSRVTIRTLIKDAEQKRDRLNNLVKMLDEIGVNANESDLLALERESK